MKEYGGLYGGLGDYMVGLGIIWWVWGLYGGFGDYTVVWEFFFGEVVFFCFF